MSIRPRSRRPMALSGWADGNYISHGASVPTFASMPTGTMVVWAKTTSSTARMHLMTRASTGGTGLNAHRWDWREDAANVTALVIDRATAILAINASLANFANYGVDKWLFYAVQWDTGTSANCKLWIGDLAKPPAEPSAYNFQTAGSGAVASDAGNPYVVGRDLTNASRQFVGPIAWHGLTPTLLSEGGVTRLWSRGPEAVRVPWYIDTMYGASAGGLQISRGYGNHGSIVGTLVNEQSPYDILPRRRAAIAAVVAAGRTTKNTRAWPLGMAIGMYRGMPGHCS